MPDTADERDEGYYPCPFENLTLVRGQCTISISTGRMWPYAFYVYIHVHKAIIYFGKINWVKGS